LSTSTSLRKKKNRRSPIRKRNPLVTTIGEGSKTNNDCKETGRRLSRKLTQRFVEVKSKKKKLQIRNHSAERINSAP